MTAILKEDPPELSEMDHPVSPGLERIVRRCLEKQPEQRFQSAKDLAFALEALLHRGKRWLLEANRVCEWGQQIGLDTLFNVMKEFWPDTRRKLFGQ